MPYTLNRPLYLSEDRNEVLEEGNTRAFWNLGGKGTIIPDAEAIRLGLMAAPGTEEKAQTGAPENKALSGAPENKALGSPTASAEEATPLPEGFPGKALLEENGIKTVEQVRTLGKAGLEQVRGIGPTLAEKIAANAEKLLSQPAPAAQEPTPETEPKAE